MNAKRRMELIQNQLKREKERLELEKVEQETKIMNSSVFTKPAQLAFLASIFSIVLTAAILISNGVFDLKFQSLKSQKADYELKIYNYKQSEGVYVKKTDYFTSLQDSIITIDRSNEELIQRSLALKKVSDGISLDRGNKKYFFKRYNDSLQIMKNEYDNTVRNLAQIKGELTQVENMLIKEKKENDKLDKIISSNKVVLQ